MRYERDIPKAMTRAKRGLAASKRRMARPPQRMPRQEVLDAAAEAQIARGLGPRMEHVMRHDGTSASKMLLQAASYQLASYNHPDAATLRRRNGLG